MSDKTKIQWADATFNPWIGCTKVSPGCKNCYAETTTRARVLRANGHETWGNGAKRARTSAATWRQPLKWDRQAAEDLNDYYAHEGLHGGHAHYNKPIRPRIFPSLCDWLDDEVPVAWLADFLTLIHDTPNLDWLLLTKRPENFHRRLSLFTDHPKLESDVVDFSNDWRCGKCPSNVWVGVSTENQEMADKRIPELLKIPAKVRFLSVEPMLGPIDFTKLDADEVCPECKERITCNAFAASAHCSCCVEGDEPIAWGELHWVIFGGESGPNARPCNAEWIRDGVSQCKAAGVAAFVKQLGANPTQDLSAHMPEADENAEPEDIAAWEYGRQNSTMHLKDKKGGDMAEWPEDLRVRQFPQPNP